MWFAYVDESGDSGAYTGGKNSGTVTYSLGCLLVRDVDWPAAFDQMILYRRFLRDRLRIPMRAEIKANYLLHNAGAFRDLKLGERIRHDIYRSHMRLVPKIGLQTFAVVVRKDRLTQAGDNADPAEMAWTLLLERLERFSTNTQEPFLIVHDRGDDKMIRKVARKSRRHIQVGSRYGGSLRLHAKFLLDDPVTRDSAQSYFVQLADLTAYAAFRAKIPPARPRVVPASMWEELGDSRVFAVAKYRWTPGQPGGAIVERPDP